MKMHACMDCKQPDAEPHQNRCDECRWKAEHGGVMEQIQRTFPSARDYRELKDGRCAILNKKRKRIGVISYDRMDRFKSFSVYY